METKEKKTFILCISCGVNSITENFHIACIEGCPSCGSFKNQIYGSPESIPEKYED